MLANTKPMVRGSLLPLLAMLFLFLIVDFFAISVVNFGVSWTGYFGFGVLQAQAGLFCILGGTVGRAWISSFLITAAWSAISVSLFFTSVANDAALGEMATFAFGVIPTLMFCGCLPFLLARGVWGWHLSRKNDDFLDAYSLRIEDLFLSMTVVAGLLATAVPAFSFTINNDGKTSSSEVIFNFLSISGIAVAASFVAVLPVCTLYFRASSRFGRIFVLFLFAAIAPIAFGGYLILSQFWNGDDLWSGIFSSMPTICYLASSALVFSLGLMVLHACGFRRVAIVREGEQSIQPGLLNKYRIQNRYAVAGVVIATLAVTLSVSRLKQSRTQLAHTFAKMNSRLLIDSGYLEYEGHIPIALKVPTKPTVSDVDLSKFQGLRSISLAGTQISESSLHAVSNIKSLMEIDVSRSTLADSSIKYLRRNKYLAHLSLAGTSVTVAGINEAMAGAHIRTLDLGELNLDDQAMKQLQIQNVGGLVLRRNPITDASFDVLSSLSYLDLSETKCNGDGFGKLICTNSLKLDGTDVDDVAIARLIAANTVLQRLSLRNTRVTDATLKTLAKYAGLKELELSDGEISAEGLMATAFAPTDRLALNSQKFAGSVFANWHPTICRLDMSHSGITDNDIRYLENIRGLQELSLADCDISDESLVNLVALNLTKLDLSGTKVTAASVAKTFPATTAVYLSVSQCTPEELSQPIPSKSIRIGLRFDATRF